MRIAFRQAAVTSFVLVAAACGATGAPSSTADASPTSKVTATKSTAPTIAPAIVYSANPSTSTTSSSLAEPTPAPTTAASVPPSITSPTTQPTAAPPAAPDPCSAYDFRNFRYYFPDYGIVTVANGVGVRGAPGTLGYVSIQIRDVAIGNIGGVDADAETAVLAMAETGTEGRYTDVYVFSCSAAAAVTLLTTAGSGDRAYGGIRSVAIVDSKLVVDRYADDQGACCPGAISRQVFSLDGAVLTAAGPPNVKKYTLANAPGPVAISFFSNTSTAAIGGDTAHAKPAGLVAYAGQRLKVAVLPNVIGENPVTIDVTHESAVLGSVSSGSSAVVTLPADGYYELKARATTPGADGAFDAEVTIGRSTEIALTG